MAEQDKKADQASDKKDTAKQADKKTDDKKAASGKDASKASKSGAVKEVKSVTMLDKYFAGSILLGIFVTAISGFGADVSFNEVFYRCMIVSLSLWAVSIVIKKYCFLLANFKKILEDMKKDSMVSAHPSEEEQQ